MVSMGFEPRATEWCAQTKPRGYGGRHEAVFISKYLTFPLVSYKCVLSH